FKIAPQKMRLTATREMKYGNTGNVGQARMEYTLFEGYMVFDHNVLNIKESNVHFNFQLSREQAKTFDVVYDYDMNQPLAKRAYFLATQGRFEHSHELAQQSDSGVTFVLSREAQGRRHLSRAQIQLSLFFHKQSAESWSLT